MFRLPTLFRASATSRPTATASIARFSQCARLGSETAVPAPQAAPEFKSQTVAPTNPPKLPYFVLRTSSAKLPVYTEIKGGGTLKQTKVRKIEGNIEKLKSALQRELGLNPSEIKINDLTKNILVKGDRKMEIQTWLIGKGF